jgi:predicted nucleic-acid-binding Zn-ribbon protein
VYHNNLKKGSIVKLLNPDNKKSVILKIAKKSKYPEFYKIMITETVANKLSLNLEIPFIEIQEIKKNKSFVAKKAKIHEEEKKIPSKAPVASVQISNISKNKVKNSKNDQNKIFLHIATFYSVQNAQFLKKRIINELINYDNKKLIIKKINLKETQVISGPYTSINLLKNDYIKFKNFGFEELDIFINE